MASNFWQSGLGLATPLLWVALGETLMERAGLLNIGTEKKAGFKGGAVAEQIIPSGLDIDQIGRRKDNDCHRSSPTLIRLLARKDG